MSRFSSFALFFCLALASSAFAHTEPDSTLTLPTAPAATVTLALAGLPSAAALPDSRVFFTVQADVCRAGELFIAAGARAKGRLALVCSTDSVPCFVLLPEAVQTTEGLMQPLEPMFVRLAGGAWQQPFAVEVARTTEEIWAEMGRGAGR